MITLYLGNLGSSKTSNAVRHMVLDNSGLVTYTNIHVKGKYGHIVYKSPKTIVKETVVTVGSKEKTQFVFNSDEWLSLKKPLNIIWDEVTFIADSRSSQTAMNKVVTEFVYMARRIVGFDKYGFGDFILIAQRAGTIDVRIRELVTTVVYHTLYWVFRCDTCNYCSKWDSELPNLKDCPLCGERTLRKDHFYSERRFFKGIDSFGDWFFMKKNTWYHRDFIVDISNYFDLYDTLQYVKY